VASRKQRDDEAAFLASYTPGKFPRPSVTVDLVVLTILDGVLSILLVARGEHPFKGRWALPGGFVRVAEGPKDQGEDLHDAALRELAEETGLPPGSALLEQLGAFGRPGRDPRTRVISVAYHALVRPTLVPLAGGGGDATSARWFPVTGRPALAFDHDEIVERALARIRRDLDDTSVAFALVPETFTIAELRTVHEVILDAALDPGNFRRRFLRMLDDGVIEPARGKRATASKPAQVYRFALKR
jgi:8-oxo-dGTP diphosphatase